MNAQRNLTQSILIVAVVTTILLLVPLTAMLFTDEVNWSIADFMIMGVLLFSTGSAYVLITRYVANLVYRAAAALTLGTTLFMIWANLGVGLIASGANLGNLMFMGVAVVVIVGSIASRFNAGGMERTAYIAALAVVLIAAIALVTNMDEYPDSSVNEILGVCGFFASLYAIAVLYFDLPLKSKRQKNQIHERTQDKICSWLHHRCVCVPVGEHLTVSTTTRIFPGIGIARKLASDRIYNPVTRQGYPDGTSFTLDKIPAPGSGYTPSIFSDRFYCLLDRPGDRTALHVPPIQAPLWKKRN
jgi:hypothetical protein